MYVMAGQLGITPVYKCTASICYGADGAGVGNGTDGLFRNLQTVANRFAARAGFKPVTVDGKLGAGTVSAVRAAGNWVIKVAGVPGGGQFGPQAVTVLTYSTTKEALAQNAQAVHDALQSLASALSLDAGGPANLPTAPAPVYTPPALPPAMDVPPINVPVTVDTRMHWAYYAAGAVAALGVLYAVWQFTKPTGV